MLSAQERLSLMPRPSLVSVCIAALALAYALPHVARADDTFSVTPRQVVTLGDGEGDAFAVEQISRNDNTVTVLLRPKGESCTFRFAVGVGRSVQLRSDSGSGQSMLCKATLQPLTQDDAAEFGAECTETPAWPSAPKCPANGDTAAIDYPQQ